MPHQRCRIQQPALCPLHTLHDPASQPSQHLGGDYRGLFRGLLALLVARGLSNREVAAAALFLTSHSSHIGPANAAAAEDCSSAEQKPCNSFEPSQGSARLGSWFLPR
jgi:hypothetical protein